VVSVERGGVEVPLGTARARAAQGLRRLARRWKGRFSPASAPGRESGGGRPRLEMLLLLACARSSPADHEEVKRLADAGIDWDLLLDRASRHGLDPLLHRRLREEGEGRCPAEAMELLRRRHEANRRRNLFLAGELVRVLGALEGAGVRGVPLKGVALAATAYGDLSLRRFTDLDVLVRRRDVPRASEALRLLGYRLQGKGDREGGAGAAEHLFSRRDGRVFVELHDDLAPHHFPIPRDLEGLWDRVVPAAGPDGFSSLSPEDTLLFLCAHGSIHLWERLLWLCDVDRWIAAHPFLDWARVAREARRLGLERVLRLGLHLAEGLLGTPLPRGWGEAARADRAVARIASRVRARILVEGRKADPFETFLFRMRVRERLRDRLLTAARLAFRISDRDRGLIPLPSLSSRDPVLYGARLFRLAMKYGPRLVRVCDGR